MSEEQIGADAPAENGGAVDTVPRSALQEVISQRQALKEQNRAHLAKLAEYEAAEQTAAEDKLRQQQENETIIQSRDAQVAELQNQLQSMQHAQRFTATVQAVAGKLEGVDSSVVEGLLLVAQSKGAEVAPESLDDKHVAELAKGIRASAPGLFQPKNTGGSPGEPGGEAPSKAYLLGQAYSPKNRR